jgi:hypothetical protein
MLADLPIGRLGRMWQPKAADGPADRLPPTVDASISDAR